MSNSETERPHEGAEREQPVWGAAAIGRVINRSPRQTYYLLENGELPAKRIGRQWCGFPSRLREYLLAESD